MLKVPRSITITYHKSFVLRRTAFHPYITIHAHLPRFPLSPPYLFCIEKNINSSSPSTMGVADPPCSGYIYEDQQPVPANRSTPTRGSIWHAASSTITGTTQIDHHTPNHDPRRRAATTSRVPRARSGWCGFSEFTIRLPGPLGKVLGRC